MDLPAIAARRVQMSLVLAAGGAIVLMVGFALAVIGEAMSLQQSGGAGGLITFGLVLVAIGLALGLACTVVTLASRQFRVPGQGPAPVTAARVAAMRAGAARMPDSNGGGRQPVAAATAPQSVAAGLGTAAPVMAGTVTAGPAAAAPGIAPDGPVADEPPADEAEDWLNPFRGAGIRPVSSTVQDIAAARDAQAAPAHAEPSGYAGPASAEPAGYAGPASAEPAGYAGPGPHAEPAGRAGSGALPELAVQYSDSGWQLDGPEPAAAAQQPAGPPPEIHHPVRSQHPAHTTGQFPAYQTGQFPAYRDPQAAGPGTGQLPAYQAGYPTGQQPAYRPDQHAAGPEESRPPGARQPGYDTGQYRS